MQGLENAGVKEFLRLVNQLREQVVLALAQSSPITPSQVEQVKAEIRQITQLYRPRFEQLLSENQRRLFIKGLNIVDIAINKGNLRLAIPYLSEQTLEQAQKFGAELITNLTDYARSQIAQQVDLGVMGQRPVNEIIAEIGRNLTSPSVFGTIARRAETIFRTEVNRMQNLAAVERMEQAAVQVPDLRKQWLHTHIGIPRPWHLFLDGKVVGVDEMFTLQGADGNIYEIQGPHDPLLPAGETVNCFMGETLVDARGIKKVYRSSYSGEVLSIKTASGHNLTGTPNHPILTPSGFVPLGQLQEGDDIFCCALGQGVTVGDPDVAYMPSRIEEIFDALACVGTTKWVRGSPMDFYGDGPSKGEIEIIWPNSELRDGAESGISQPLRELDFVRRNVGKRPLSAKSPIMQMLSRRFPPSYCRMSSRNLPQSLLLGESLPSNEERPPQSTGLDVGFEKSATYYEPVDGETIRQSEFGKPGSVEASDRSHRQVVPIASDGDLCAVKAPANALQRYVQFQCDLVGTLSNSVSPEKITFLRRGEVEKGHVYTFQTVSGIYNAGGIVASNCHCVVIPWVGRFHGQGPA